MFTPPDMFIADTQEVIKEYKRLTLNLEPLGLHGLDTWMGLIVDAVGIEAEIDYNKSLLQYEMAGDFLYEDRPEGTAIIQAAEGLIMGVYKEFKRNGLYDERGSLPWLFTTTTPDFCIVLTYHDRIKHGDNIPRCSHTPF